MEVIRSTVDLNAGPPAATATAPIPTRIPATQAAVPHATDRWSDLLLAWADRHRHFLLATLFLAYVLGYNGRWRVEPDSGLYLSVARNLAEGKGYTYHGQPHALAYPGLPYALAALLKVFGTASLWPANLLMLLCGLGALGLTYRLIRLHADRPTAVVVTLGVGLTRTFYRYSFQIMTDMPFLLGVMAFFTGYEAILRRDENGRWLAGPVDWILMAGGLGLAVVMRPTMWAFLPVVAVALLWSSLKGCVSWKWAVAAVAAAAVAVGLFVHFDPRQKAGVDRPDRYEDQFVHVLKDNPGQFRRQVTQNLRDTAGETAVVAMFGLKLGSPVINAIAGLPILALGMLLVRRRLAWGLWVMATAAMMVLVLAHDRYFLQVFPLLVFAWWQGLTWVNRTLPLAWGNIAFALLLVSGIAPNVGQVGAIVIEQHRKPFLDHYRGGRYAPMVQMGKALPTFVPEDAVVVAPAKTSRVMTFLSGRNVIESNEMSGTELLNPHLFVVSGPGDANQLAWTREQGVRLDRPVFTLPREGIERLELWSAHLDRSAWEARPPPQAVP